MTLENWAETIGGISWGTRSDVWSRFLEIREGARRLHGGLLTPQQETSLREHYLPILLRQRRLGIRSFSQPQLPTGNKSRR